MAEVLLTLGEYQFSMDTAAHEEMQRKTSYRWKSQQRLSREPAMQYMGPGSTTISLGGSIFPHFMGGLEQIDAMKAMAGEGEPMTLVDGRGNNLGRYCIKDISDTEKRFVLNGLPRQIDFQMQLELYGEDAVPAQAGSGSGGDSADSSGNSGGNSGVNWAQITDLAVAGAGIFNALVRKA